MRSTAQVPLREGLDAPTAGSAVVRHSASAPSGTELDCLAPGTPLSLTGVIKAWPSQLNRGQP